MKQGFLNRYGKMMDWECANPSNANHLHRNDEMITKGLLWNNMGKHGKAIKLDKIKYLDTPDWLTIHPFSR